MDEYKTISGEACAEFTEKRSRFIGRIKPVRTAEEAASFIHAVKAEHYNAKHNVYAYCLRAGQKRRCSDDGEPQGTGGVPVLDVIVKSGVTDAAIVVTRYFGGVLLGTGGLVRAYSRGASAALEQAKVITMKLCCLMSLQCGYGEYGKVCALISEYGGTVDDTEFTDSVQVGFRIACEKMSAFQQSLADATSGACHAETVKKDFYPNP